MVCMGGQLAGSVTQTPETFASWIAIPGLRGCKKKYNSPASPRDVEADSVTTGSAAVGAVPGDCATPVESNKDSSKVTLYSMFVIVRSPCSTPLPSFENSCNFKIRAVWVSSHIFQEGLLFSEY